jgi:hypothetical protein
MQIQNPLYEEEIGRWRRNRSDNIVFTREVLGSQLGILEFMIREMGVHLLEQNRKHQFMMFLYRKKKKKKG